MVPIGFGRKLDRQLREHAEQHRQALIQGQEIEAVMAAGRHKKIDAALELGTHALAGLAEYQQLCDQAVTAQPSLEEHAYDLQQALVFALAEIVRGKEL